jgi:hypothetical protein
MKRLLFSMLVLLVLFGCSSPVVVDDPKPEDPIDNEDPIVIVDPIERSIFSGLEYNDEKYEAFAIMIENTAAARPQSGLSLADIVYEITVDGWNISRMIAIFSTNHPTKVGPVRSARMPFVYLMKEWKLPFVHFGSAATGQGDALTLLKSINLPIRFDGHKGLNDEFYSRDSARTSPHNAYFNADKAKVKIPELSYEQRFTFDEVSNVDDSDVLTIFMKYSSINNIKYVFDLASKTYLRFVNNEPHMDAYTGRQIGVTNIIVLHAPHRSVETVEYVLVDFVGEGKAEYFVNGKHEVGTWLKSSDEAITKYFDSTGEEIVLLPGNTWIQVVHNKIIIDVE